jgi:hypothetical protein
MPVPSTPAPVVVSTRERVSRSLQHLLYALTPSELRPTGQRLLHWHPWGAGRVHPHTGMSNRRGKSTSVLHAGTSSSKKVKKRDDMRLTFFLSHAVLALPLRRPVLAEKGGGPLSLPRPTPLPRYCASCRYCRSYKIIAITCVFFVFLGEVSAVEPDGSWPSGHSTSTRE